MTSPISALAGRRVLVTGATGFTGSVVVRRLAALGATVVAIARPASRRDHLGHLNIEWIEGDVFDREVAAGARGRNRLRHSPGSRLPAGGTIRRLSSSRPCREHRAPRAGRGGAAVVRAVSAGVDRRGARARCRGPRRRDRAVRAGDAYQRTKAEAETWLREFAPGAGLPFSIVRPCAIYGPGDTRLLKVFKMASWGSSRARPRPSPVPSDTRR